MSKKTKDLGVNTTDKAVSTIKSVMGMIPIYGTLIGEVIDHLIPKLRIDRIETFLKELANNLDDSNYRISCLESRVTPFERNLETEEGIAIFEEGILQATRAVSEERQKRLAKLVFNSLSAEELRYEVDRKLLNIFKELTDSEIIWLIYYSFPSYFGPETKRYVWCKKHPEVLKPISNNVNTTQKEQEALALQNEYKATLLRLNLTNKKENTTTTTILGGMLVSYIFDEVELGEVIEEKNK